jgi:hypothetical protein
MLTGAAGWILILVGQGTFTGPRGGEAELRREVGAYLGVFDASAAEREEILDRLRFVPASLLRGALLQAFKEPDVRPAAFDLAARLRVPGLAEAARKSLGTPDEPAVLRLLFATQEKGQLPSLIDRWLKTPPEDPAFDRLAAAFRMHDVGDLETLARLQAVVERGPGSEIHRLRAADLLAVQMGIEPGNRDLVLAAWKGFRATFMRDAAAFPLAGLDLLPAVVADRSAARRVGPNLRLAARARIAWPKLPPTIQTGDFVVRLRILPEGPDGLTVALREWRVQAAQGEWVVRSSLGTFVAPLRVGEWNEISFAVDDLSARGGAREKRRVLISADRKPLGTQKGWLDGVIEGLVVETGRSGATLGGVEFVPKAP